MPKEKSSITMPRRQNNYEILEFSPVKIDGKRVAVCNICGRKLSNTGFNRLKKHRLVCAMKTKNKLDTGIIPMEIKTEEIAEEPPIMQFEEQSTEVGSLTSEKLFDEEFEDPVVLTEREQQNFSLEESVDMTFLKSMLSLMRDLPADVKDDFQATMYQKIYKLRAQNRKNKTSNANSL